MSNNIVLRSIVIITLIGFFTSCSSGLPTTKEHLAIEADRKVIILLRITCEHDTGKPIFAFPGFWGSSESIRFYLISFETGGELKTVFPRWLSDEEREEGWAYLMLETGTTYLCPNSYGVYRKTYPLWVIDIPIESHMVYIGTLHLNCKTDQYANYCLSYDEGKMVVRNEEALARKMAALYFPDFTAFQTVLMRRHDSPTIILRTPRGK